MNTENGPRLWKTPQSLELAITNRCNLRCRYCAYFNSPADVGRDLPLNEWLKFFEELNRCAVMNVVLEGGEPFCREDIKEIIAGIVENRLRYTILTNGILIDDEMAKFIASTHRCNNIQVSIDGSSPATHDICRGEGSFDKALRGLQCIRRHNIPLDVRVTIHRGNVHDLDEIAYFLLEEIGIPTFSTNYVIYLGKGMQNRDQVLLTPEENSFAMDALVKLDKKYPNRIRASSGPLAQGKGWSAMEKARCNGLPAMPSSGRLAACKGVMRQMGVRADGVMVPCGLLSHIEIGRINIDSLQEVWLNHPELKRLRERRNIPLSHFEFCSGCSYINYCMGSCPAMAYTHTGKEDYPSPDSCLKRFLEDGGKLPVSRTSVESECDMCK
jgi:SynChlorMet cassette radical SAM/SPASM protein ScmE